ncbi:hypothetical protein CROQUDRAFT_716845 [Cronartium quercuum f. sp. fusiforme G11]|uniref:Uncharacterized protein n=1 Tax=Cronartium quercuum f. sp. fusiforme G11 TaxID=708437 RepID=A0A9P6T9Z4_9BASI|nr:hypothetical protein CROQUDRAFT_716845 [Cronartium quercuum f. sp. fusiforme G11]
MQRYLAAWSAVLCLVALFHSVVGAPTHEKGNSTTPSYKEFQVIISDKEAGNALKRAIDAYKTFAGGRIFEHLVEVTTDKRETIAHMRKAAQNSEAKFVEKLATLKKESSEFAEFKRGMISNKVLKLTGMVLLIESDIAKTGKSDASADSLEKVQQLLQNNIKLDHDAAGLPQRGVA